MDVSSLNSLLSPLPTPQTSQDSSVASAATDGNAPDPTKVSTSTGQDLPSADQSAAGTATVGPSTATLSPDIQALLLQTQEATAAVSFLNNGMSSDQDPLLSAIGGTTTQNTDDPTLDDILAELQGNSGTQSTPSTSDLDQILAALQDTGSSQTSSGTTLSDVLAALQGTNGTQSSTTGSGGLDAVLAALQGTDGTSAQDPLLAALQGGGSDQTGDVMQFLMQNMGIGSGANTTIDSTTQSLLNLMNSGEDGASDPMLASFE